jgi:hypothetical protein
MNFGAILVGSGLLLLLFSLVWLLFVRSSSLKNELSGSILSEDGIVGDGKAGMSKGQFVVTSLALFAGVLTTAIYRELRKSGRVNWSTFYVNIAIGVIVSPLVLRAVLDGQAVKGEPLHKAALSAYQTGFCWEAVLGEIAR